MGGRGPARDVRRARRSEWPKKKGSLTEARTPDPASRESLWKSALERSEGLRQTPSRFLPPEELGAPQFGFGDDADLAELPLEGVLSPWDIATRYHEFKAHPRVQNQLKALRRISAEAILGRAREILGSLVHPRVGRVMPLDALPGDAEGPELSVEETLEESTALLSSRASLGPSDLYMEYSERRAQAVVLTVDTSLSMTGEKLALTAVALAVVLLQFPEDPVGIIAFENAPKVLKRPSERLTLGDLVERFLDVPAKGYTHLEAGLRAALTIQADRAVRRASVRCATVLLSDGKYTAGRDPSFLAPRFHQLQVLKMGRDRASRELCEDLARAGGGRVREIAQLEQLPHAMYAVVKDLLRGRARG